jgi:hypothetical protein
VARMSRKDAEVFLAGSSHKGTMILSVPRDGKGPLSVPLAFRFTRGGFEFSTKPSRLHAKAFLKAGRATVIVHYENYGPGGTLEQYVTAEGPIGFVDLRVPPDSDSFHTARLEPETFIAMEYT